MTDVAAVRATAGSVGVGGSPRLLPADGSPETLTAHLRRHGERPRVRALAARSRAEVEVERSGLTGRGGAAFPTAAKLAAVRAAPGRPVVVANGAEGEPASRKDRTLLALAPHLVIDGAVVAAELVGADQVVLNVHRDVRRILDRAVVERAAAGVDDPPIAVVTAAPRFVAGEASAVVNWLEGRRPVPRAKPPRLSDVGLTRRPTLVNNVETLAHLALVARHGSAWFREAGTPGEPGTALVTVVDGPRTWVGEVSIGATVGDLLVAAGVPAGRVQAVLVGGYIGTWLPGPDALTRPFSAGGLGASLGAGLLAVLPPDACGLAEAARLAGWLASQSAGQCGPCVLGLGAISAQLDNLARGRPARLLDLRRWLEEIRGRGACGHPDGVARMVASALEVFDGELEGHRRGLCSGGRATPVLPLPPAGDP